MNAFVNDGSFLENFIKNKDTIIATTITATTESVKPDIAEKPMTIPVVAAVSAEPIPEEKKHDETPKVEEQKKTEELAKLEPETKQGTNETAVNIESKTP